MNLHTYLEANSITAVELAKRIGAKSSQQVQQWRHRYNNRLPGPVYCLAIERETKGAVTRQDLRPNDYWLIWPDLKAPEKEAA